VETSEYRAIAKGDLFMTLLFFAGVGTAFLIAYLNDRGIIGPLNTVEVSEIALWATGLRL